MAIPIEVRVGVTKLILWNIGIAIVLLAALLWPTYDAFSVSVAVMVSCIIWFATVAGIVGACVWTHEGASRPIPLFVLASLPMCFVSAAPPISSTLIEVFAPAMAESLVWTFGTLENAILMFGLSYVAKLARDLGWRKRSTVVVVSVAALVVVVMRIRIDLGTTGATFGFGPW